MLKYPISTLLYLAKINIKDKIKDALHLKNNLDMRLSITIKDKNGKIIKQHKQHSHSFLTNFATMLMASMVESESANFYYFRVTAGTWYSFDVNTDWGIFYMNDGANDSTYGIVVGTGITPPTPNDYNLENIISNGTGSGQLVYGATSISPKSGTSPLQAGTSEPTTGVLTPSGNTTSFSVSRTFQNQSGSPITVSEVGIIATLLVYNNIQGYVLIIHDLLSSAITIPNGGVMAITYTISVTT